MTTEPNSPIFRRLDDMVEGGRLAGARALLAAVKTQAGPSADLIDLEARLLLREGRGPEAIDVLSRGIDGFPQSALLRGRRAEARIGAPDPSEAVLDAADAVMLDPDCSWMKALLGVSLLDAGCPQDAAACLAEAVRNAPAQAGYRRALATAFERQGQSTAAAETLAAGIVINPGDLSLRTAAIMVEMRRRDFPRVVELAEAARRDGVVDACVLGLLGHALSSLGEHASAAPIYAEALKLAPEDPYVRHLVAASGLLPQASRAPAEYVETVFDGYAARFETHLLTLGYRIPGLVRQALLAAVPNATTQGLGAVLDLGCGTGLIGVALSDMRVDALTGVDLSSAMLREADAKGTCTELVHAEIETFLAGTPLNWQVIIAADVFCYFGAVDNVLALARERLAPGGLMICSMESSDTTDPTQRWRLGRQGRYSHTASYLRHAVAEAGFEVADMRDVVLRDEADAPVGGHLLTLRRRLDA